MTWCIELPLDDSSLFLAKLSTVLLGYALHLKLISFLFSIFVGRDSAALAKSCQVK